MTRTSFTALDNPTHLELRQLAKCRPWWITEKADFALRGADSARTKATGVFFLFDERTTNGFTNSFKTLSLMSSFATTTVPE